MILDLLEKPDDFIGLIKRTSASISSIILYGFRATSPDSFWATVSLMTLVDLDMQLT